MNFDLLHPAEQLVMIMARIYKYGMTTTSGGNISILDDNGDIWITPSGIDKGSLTPEDIVQVKANGAIEGIHKPSIELPLHKKIYQIRSDIKAIIHAHPPALVAFSIVRKIPNTRLIPEIHFLCQPVEMAEYALPGSTDLGEKIAAKFKNGCRTVILQNHGVVVGSKNLFTAFTALEAVNFCANLEIKANKIGTPTALTDKQIDMYMYKQNLKMNKFIPKSCNDLELAARREMCELIHRSYNQKLFTSTQGTFSQRLNENSFIITPYGFDRKYMEPSDIVLIQNNQKELDKIPCPSVILHKNIYEKHPDVNSIIIASPPNIMAFAVTEAEFQTKIIPESYIVLRNILKLPFDSRFSQPDMTANYISKKAPILLIKNSCIIVTGNSLLNAFDRLEVAEYSAKAIISSKDIGEIINISDSEVANIEKAFKLGE